MNTIDFTSIAFSTIPAIITGGIAYYFFKTHIQNENDRRNFELLQQGKKLTLPARLQAYERITLFLERINPSQLLIRIKPLGDNKNVYSSILLSTIEQEYEHNISQQIYISEECWNVITTSKNAVAHIISEITKDNLIKNSQELREGILKKMLDTTPPSAIALSFLKAEVFKIL
ncbi:hypothetical protein [Flavicella sp.]|uniref:DUF7935 family protein n=1 Tax=Flavicella sp. TaxID=2957742 RepID=UPI0030182507